MLFLLGCWGLVALGFWDVFGAWEVVTTLTDPVYELNAH